MHLCFVSKEAKKLGNRIKARVRLVLCAVRVKQGFGGGGEIAVYRELRLLSGKFTAVYCRQITREVRYVWESA